MCHIFSIDMLNVILLRVIMMSLPHFIFCYAGCQRSVCCEGEVKIFIIVMLNAIMLNAIRVTVIMLNIVLVHMLC
jgi:hypothetical protein